MFKRIMSVMLAIVMLLSVAMIATSAAQVEIADNSADAVAEVAADGAADTGADAGADTGAGNVINFKVEVQAGKTSRKFSATSGNTAEIHSLLGRQKLKLVKMKMATASGLMTSTLRV